MPNRYVLGLDPSGNYDEGKGITGWCLYDRETGKVCKFGVLDSKNFASRVQYWEAHILLIDEMLGYHPDIVCEDYLLYATTTEAQTNSRLETPRLIGVIEYECFMRGVKVHFQTAAQVKIRWSEKILVHKGLLTCNGNKYLLNGVVTQDHTRDALKHALHFATFGTDEGGILYDKEKRRSRYKYDSDETTCRQKVYSKRSTKPIAIHITKRKTSR